MSTDGTQPTTSVDEIWRHLEKGQELSRKANQETLDSHVAAACATSLALSNQLLMAGLIADSTEDDVELEKSASNPQVPAPA